MCALANVEGVATQKVIVAIFRVAISDRMVKMIILPLRCLTVLERCVLVIPINTCRAKNHISLLALIFYFFDFFQ